MFDQEAAALLRVLDEGFPPVQDMSPAQARSAIQARQAAVTNLDDVASTRDLDVPGPAGPVRVRVYDPHPQDRADRQSTIVFAHGGGFVLCSIDSHDGFCRSLAKGTGATVVSVEYRLAPEHPAPAAVDDVYAAVRWAAAELPGRLFVAGDSAGGNIAIGAALATLRSGGPSLDGQILLYPVIDPSCDMPSQRSHGTGYFLTNAAMRWYWKHYLGQSGVVSDLVAPLRTGSLKGLPPAVIVIGRLDPLHSEVVAYADALAAAGVPVTLREYPDLFHGFATIGPFRPAASARSILFGDIRAL
jgi:acetyl esterase